MCSIEGAKHSRASSDPPGCAQTRVEMLALIRSEGNVTDWLLYRRRPMVPRSWTDIKDAYPDRSQPEEVEGCSERSQAQRRVPRRSHRYEKGRQSIRAGECRECAEDPTQGMSRALVCSASNSSNCPFLQFALLLRLPWLEPTSWSQALAVWY